MYKLLISNTSEEFCAAVAELLSDTFDVRHCCEGNRAMELIKSFCPDMICLDMTLSGMDGLSILEKTIAFGLNPVVLVIGDCFSEYVVSRLNCMGVGFVMRKPCIPSVVAGRLTDMRDQNDYVFNNPLAEKDPLESMLHSLGFNTKSKNYNCVKQVLSSFMNNPKQAITKELYPSVATICGGNKDQVEKAVRDAIHTAWKHRDNVFWQKFFPELCRMEKCPRNGDFIRAVTYLLSTKDIISMRSPDTDQHDFAGIRKYNQIKEVSGL